MVRALLDGSKTQTRRVAKLTANGHVKEPGGHRRWHTADFDARLACPYGQPGDRLWVRETWNVARETLDYETGGEYDVWEWPEELGDPREHLYGDARFGTKAGLFYAADGQDNNPGVFYDLTGIDNKTILRPKEISWRPSIHMPRWASRITLEVTGVRVERLQDISEADAIAEGAPAGFWEYDNGEGTETAKESYECLWGSINGPESWGANPLVWVVEFKLVKGAKS